MGNSWLYIFNIINEFGGVDMNNLIKNENNVVTISGEDKYQKLMEIAINANADVDKLEKLMDLQERFERKEAKKAFSRALARFQSQCPVIKKTKTGHNFSYAPMCDVIDQVKELEAACGLSHRFEQESTDDTISITCVLSHVDGHSEKLKLDALADQTGSKNAVQAIGSTITYLQRYSFLGSLGIATADEDMDGRRPKPEGKGGNWKPGKDYNLLPSSLREVFLNLNEAYQSGDYQHFYEIFETFDIQEEKIAVWNCFASDERSELNKFGKSEYKRVENPDRKQYCTDKEFARFEKRFNG